MQVERFRCHNGQWLSVVETLGEGGAGDCADDLPPYLSAQYLTQHRLTTSGKLIPTYSFGPTTLSALESYSQRRT